MPNAKMLSRSISAPSNPTRETLWRKRMRLGGITGPKTVAASHQLKRGRNRAPGATRTKRLNFGESARLSWLEQFLKKMALNPCTKHMQMSVYAPRPPTSWLRLRRFPDDKVIAPAEFRLRWNDKNGKPITGFCSDLDEAKLSGTATPQTPPDSAATPSTNAAPASRRPHAGRPSSLATRENCGSM
jgi:hypothetical protein